MGNKQAKAQAAVDFLASYGLALVLITIVIVIIYQVAIADRYVFSNSCTPSPGFSCGFYSINSNGILTLQISQATGGPIQAEGIACAWAFACLFPNRNYFAFISALASKSEIL